MNGCTGGKLRWRRWRRPQRPFALGLACLCRRRAAAPVRAAAKGEVGGLGMASGVEIGGMRPTSPRVCLSVGRGAARGCCACMQPPPPPLLPPP